MSINRVFLKTLRGQYVGVQATFRLGSNKVSLPTPWSRVIKKYTITVSESYNLRVPFMMVGFAPATLPLWMKWVIIA